MLSIKPISNGANYRYYLEKEAIGQWVGKGAEMLGLPQQVTADDFSAIRKGEHPETGEGLRIRRVVDRQYKKPWGIQTYEARELYDVVISAPKTVSIQAQIDPEVKEAHRQAVAGVREGMEDMCGAMVIAQYEHGYSRKLDPQTHTHLVAANMAHDGEKWRALHANNLYRSQGEITEDYRQRLTDMLERWGYKVDYPELAGITPEVKARFSQGAQRRDESIKKHMEAYGLTREDVKNREIAMMVRKQRPEKAKLTPDELRARVMERLEPHERAELIRLKDQAERVRQGLAEGPWMAQRGGVENLSPKLRESAQRSYQKWQHKEQHSFADYVAFTQKRWAENPGLLEAWKNDPRRVEGEMEKLEGKRVALDDSEVYETGLKKKPWDYGESNRTGPRMRM